MHVQRHHRKNPFPMKALILSLLSLCAISASAQTGNYLTFRQANGNETSLSTNGLRITFENGNLVATNGSEKATFALADMGLMFFSPTPTAIHEAASTDGITASIVGGTLRTNAPAGTAVSVYSPDGRLMPLTGLQSGAYIVRIGEKVVKLMAR